MKKILFSLCLVAATITIAAAQKTAESIMSNYEKITGLNNVDLANPDLSMMMDFTVSAQGNKMPMKMITQGKEKFRIDMEAMGQKMFIVRDGDKGWMSMAGQIQPMPKEALEQQADQTNIMGSVKFNNDKYTYEYLGTEDGLDKIKSTPKDATAKETSTVYFNAKGLIEKIDSQVQGQNFTMNFTEYKKFGDVLIPTVMSTTMGGKEAAVVTINDVVMDYPTAAWMFAEPKAE